MSTTFTRGICTLGLLAVLGASAACQSSSGSSGASGSKAGGGGAVTGGASSGGGVAAGASGGGGGAAGGGGGLTGGDAKYCGAIKVADAQALTTAPLGDGEDRRTAAVHVRAARARPRW
jgi:hypothetical protein